MLTLFIAGCCSQSGFFNPKQEKTVVQNPKNSLAYVYVIENSLGVVKVGIATNPAKRFKAITASSGLPIVQSHLSPLCLNYLAVEKALLAYFKDFRVQGEWLQGIDYKTVCSALDSHFSSLPAPVESQSNNPVIFDFENHQLRTINELVTQVYELQRQVTAIQSLLPTSLIQSTKSDAINRFSSDVESLKRFYSECTVNDVDAYLPIGIIGFSRTTHLYPAYVAWCEREGVRGVSLNYFSRTSIRAIKCLGWQGIHHDKTRTGKVIRGISFNEAANHG